MTTATKTKPKAARRSETLPRAARLDTKRVDASPYQPRTDFPQMEIAELAASIELQGQLYPIIVRAKGKRYELLDGERRLRAVRHLGLPTIRAEIQEKTDTEARAIVLAAALHHKDLNPIEEARAFQQFIAAGDAAGPTELADRLGLSQGQVSNRLRLLKLPAGMQQRVISREMTATHAREIARYADHPGLLAAIEKEIARELKYNGELPGPKFFTEAFLDPAVYRNTQPMDGEAVDKASGRRIPVFKPSEREEQQLKIVEMTGGERRAANVNLWKKLQTAHARKFIQEHPANKASGKQPKNKSNTKTKTETAAEKRRRAREQARLFQQRLSEWRIHWQRFLIARTLLDDASKIDAHTAARAGDLLRLLVMIIARNAAAEFDIYRRFKDYGVRPRAGGGKLFAAIAALDDSKVGAFAAAVAGGFFYDAKEGPRPQIDADTVEAVAGHLAVDLEAAWRRDQAGPLSEAFWNLHNLPQLAALGKELQVEITPSMKKAQAVARFLSRQKAGAKTAGGALAMPKEIARVKPKS